MTSRALGPLSFFRLVFSLCLLLALLSGCASAPSTSAASGAGSNVAPLAISSVTPKDVPVGSSAVTIVVTGTGFTPTTVIQLSGASVPTTFVSSTEVRATIPASQLRTGTILKLSVVNGTQVVAADTSNNVQVSNPVPTVSTLAPGSILVGSPAGTITVTGTNFVSGITLAVNGSPRSTTYVSDTQLTASLAADDFVSAAPLLLNAVNPQPGGGASGTIALVVANPAPSIASLSPSALNAGSSATAVNIVGSGFIAGTGVLVNGAARPATITNSTAMQVTLTPADLANAGSLGITAVNPAPGGGISASSAIAINNPAPGAITLTPAAAVAGTGTAQITIAGSSFVPATVVYINGQPRTTTYVNPTQLVTSLTSADLATAGSLSVVATNPNPGGGSTAPALLPVNNPAPGSITVTPNLVTTGNATETPITVTGANFVSSTVVQVNGTSRPTTFISSTQLLSSLTVADQATAGSLSVNAFTPTPGGGTSSAASIAINNSSLGFISLSPSTVPAGKSTSTTVTVTGTGMVPGTGIQVNGSARATTYVSANQVTFVLPASDVAAAGKLNVTAVNPVPNYSVSVAATLTVASPTPTPVITSLSPTTAILGSPAFTLSALGTGFNSNCTLQWNTTNLTTSYGYGTIYNPGTGYTTGYFLYGGVPASLLTTTGSASITANCPTAVTPTSNAVTFNVNNPPVPTLTSLSVPAGPIATDTKLSIFGTGFASTSTVSYNGQPLTTTYTNSGSLTATIPASQVLFPATGKVTVTTPAPGGGTSNALAYTVYVPIVSNSMVYNPVNGLLYLSIPSSVGAPYGNSIVSMDPATGAFGTPIPVGSEPNKLALTSDGKYLWVGLDGASGVRKVDLTTNTAGLQFALSINSNYYYGNPQTALNLIALPGASDSVIVLQGSAYYSSALGIYDSGVLRGALSTQNYNSQYALQVDSSRSEIYVGGSGLSTYTYNASGLTVKLPNSYTTSISLASGSFDEMQLANGKLYGDFGKVYDAEAGTLLGTMYQSGTTIAQGPTLVDTAQNKLFVLGNSSSCCYSGYNQIQIFSPDDFSTTGVTIPISVPYSINTTTGSPIYLNANRLVRWGSNGLAFHTNAGIFVIESNGVKDISSTVADLAVAVTASANATTGATSTYTVKVTNNGPSTASDVALAIQVPSTGVLASATTTSGACATSTSGCNLGSVASGSTVTITVSILQTTAGTATLGASVSGSSTDNNSANDSGSASLSVTGSDYNLLPTLSSIAPNAIKSGSTDTSITVTGTNFVPGSTVMLGATPLTTTYTSSTKLSATVPAAQLASMGWSSVSVSSPAPGGGTSNSTQLTVYTVLALGVNHIVYDPYSRKLMASVSTGSSSTNGTSLVAITPDTASIGTPVPLTNIPTKLALSDSGQTLYVANSTASSIVRYNMLTGTMDTLSLPAVQNYSYYTPYAAELTVQPGTENTLAISLGNYTYSSGIYDYSTTTKTLTERVNYARYNSFGCMRFLDPSTLFASSNSNSVTYFGVDANGFTSTTGTTTSLPLFNCFKIMGSKAFTTGGGVAALSSGGGVTQIGSFTLPSSYYYYSTDSPLVAPDISLGQAFLPGPTPSSTYGYVDGLLSYDLGNYLRTGSISLNMSTIEGSTSYSIQDVARWGQDGLAVLTSTGHIYLVRGPFVVPQFLNINTAAVLTASSNSTINHGTGNTLITVTGSNFVPGVGVMWNGSYRTTTMVDATHLTVAIPASDLATAGSASLTAMNPGAAASSALTITIQ